MIFPIEQSRSGMLNPGSQVAQVPPRDRLWRSPDAVV